MLRPTFLSFETAKKALAISQLGLDTVGHNIANAQTPGYTRQRVDQVSLSYNGSAAKYQTFGMQFPGTGADLQGIRQIRDPYLDNRYRAEAAVNGELAVKESGLTDINGIFDEIMTDGLHSKMGDLVNALDVFAQSADSKELAMVVRNTANQLVSILNKNAQDLESARVQQKLDLGVTVSENVNSIIEKIAALNVKIKEDNFYGNPANELNDERNLLIDNLSEYLDIKVTRNPIKISNDLTIYELGIELRDVTDANGKTISLVNSGQYNQLKVTEDPASGDVKLSIVEGISGFDLHGDITNKLYKGAIKGYVDVINGSGPSAPSGSSTFKGIPFYQASLDEFAQKLASVFNSVNNITQNEADRSGDPPLLSATYEKNLFGPLIPSLKSASSTEPVPPWMESVASGTLGFSNSNYNFTFATNHPTTPDRITATMTGADGETREYVAEYKPNSAIEFVGADGTVAFTVSTTGVLPAQHSEAVVDATVTARNIALTPNWLENPLYVTTTKFNPVTQAQASLFLTGSQPSWLKSVELGGDDITVKDASYEFKIDTISHELQVAIPAGSSTIYTYKLGDDNKLPKNSTISLTRTDASGNTVTGLKIVTTEKDFGTTSLDNTANIKNSSGAANDNILKFKEAIKASNAYSVGGFAGSFEGFLVDFQGGMALDQSYNQSLSSASNLLIAGFADRRDSISAVSIDEEGINMMTYQNYYNAAARYMTTLDEALDKIINGMGTVGR